MDDAMRERVVDNLRDMHGFGDAYSDELLREFAEQSLTGNLVALDIAMDDLRRTLTRDTWPGRTLVRIADVSSRALARMVRR